MDEVKSGNICLFQAKDEDRVPAHKSFKFVFEHLAYVAPSLLQLLARQPDQDEGDDWVPSKAASVCLMLIAQCVQDEVVQHVVPFVGSNIANPDWHFRDAACVAFGQFFPELFFFKKWKISPFFQAPFWRVRSRAD
jgi:importin subunit beta-1